jgi:hypothetical protein
MVPVGESKMDDLLPPGNQQRGLVSAGKLKRGAAPFLKNPPLL